MQAVKGKWVPLQAWTGPEGSRKLRFPDFVTTAQNGGKVVGLMHRQPLPPQKILLVLISFRGWVDSRAVVRSEGFYVQWKFVAQHLNHSAIERILCQWNYYYYYHHWPPLWSSGQGFWLQIQRSRVWFLSGSGSGTGCTQPREPREVNWGATWIK